jgi:hypothetical protein
MLRPSLFGCPPFRQPSSLEPRGCSSQLCGCQRSCSSELRRQTSGCFFKSDSARLTVCTGALCDRQPASATLPCPMTAPWLPACSAVRQYVRVGCRSEPLQNSGLRWHLIRNLSLNKCATHITVHPAAPPNPKTLCEAAALCLSRPKNIASDLRVQARHASFLGAFKSARPPVHRLLSRTWLIYQKHPLNLAASWPAEICRPACSAAQTELLTTVTSPTRNVAHTGDRPEGLDRLAKTKLEQKVRSQGGACGQQLPGSSTGSNS